MPTPWTVFELVKAISNVDHSWKEFMLIDMGGATTDVYSACANTLSPDTVFTRRTGTLRKTDGGRRSGNARLGSGGW